jgi:hypothetical protein
MQDVKLQTRRNGDAFAVAASQAQQAQPGSRRNSSRVAGQGATAVAAAAEHPLQLMTVTPTAGSQTRNVTNTAATSC